MAAPANQIYGFGSRETAAKVVKAARQVLTGGSLGGGTTAQGGATGNQVILAKLTSYDSDRKTHGFTQARSVDDDFEILPDGAALTDMDAKLPAMDPQATGDRTGQWVLLVRGIRKDSGTGNSLPCWWIVGGGGGSSFELVYARAADTAGGKYIGRSITGSVTTPLAISGNLSMPPSGLAVSGTDDLHLYHPFEDGLGTHILPVPFYTFAQDTGAVTNEATPRRIMILVNNGIRPGSSQYDVYNMVTATAAGWGPVKAKP